MHSQSVMVGTFLLFASMLVTVPAVATDTATSTVIPEEAAEQKPKAEQAGISAEEVKQEAREALGAAQQQKEAYQEQMQKRLQELKTQMEELKAKTAEAGEHAKV